MTPFFITKNLFVLRSTDSLFHLLILEKVLKNWTLIIFVIFSNSLIAGDSGLNAIYGKDNRSFISLLTQSKVLNQAKSVAMIVSEDLLVKRMGGMVLLGAPLKETLNLCADERFAKKPSSIACTGFLVKSNLLLTAGHCIVDESDCKTKKILFEVLDSSTKLFSSERKLISNQIFSCKKIVGHSSDEAGDFSLIELDREALGRDPLVLNEKSSEKKPNHVYMIGHPYGLSLMYSQSALVDGLESELQIKASLDSFEGNSGSPVFNSETRKVEGILINGQDDLYFDSQNKCYRNSVYNGAGGEGILKISSILPFLQ